MQRKIVETRGYQNWRRSLDRQAVVGSYKGTFGFKSRKKYNFFKINGSIVTIASI